MFCRRIIRAAVRRMLLLASKPIRGSIWYQSQFIDYDRTRHPNNDWYRIHPERNFDVVVLGSSGAKWAFEFDGLPIKGMNWAEQPQLMVDDFNLLKNYHSILKRGGTVVITLLPFSSLNKPGSVMQTFRYLRVFQNREDLLDYRFADAATLYERYPVLLGWSAIKEGVKHLLRLERPVQSKLDAYKEKNELTEKQLMQDAELWVKGWKQQFRIPDFEYALTPQNAYDRKCKVILMQELIDFCIERGYQPIIVIPPVTKYLSKYFTSRFREVYIDSFIRETNRDVKVFDYLMDEALSDETLYFNSFFMNKRGRRLFTERVLTDIGLR